MTALARVHGLARWRGEEGVPRPALLPPMLRRRTSPLTRAAAEVLGRLQERTGVELAAVPMVFGSSLGEMGTTVGLLAMMQEGDGALSPTRFHNSVHNTAGGYVSIATGNRSFSTALAAGPETVAMALLEAIGVVHALGRDVVLVMAEEALPEPLGGPAYESLAVALHLGPPEGGGDHLHLDAPRHSSPSEVLPLPPSLGANPCAPAWTLADALEQSRAGRLAVGPVQPDGDALCTELRRGGA